MIKVICDHSYFTKNELQSIKNDNRLKHLNSRNAFIYNSEYENDLINDYPSLKAYLDEYSEYTFEKFISNSYLGRELNVANIEIDFEGVAESMLEYIDCFWDKILESDNPDKLLIEVEQAIISHQASVAIMQIIKELESHDGLFFEVDFLKMDGTKYYTIDKITFKGKQG